MNFKKTIRMFSALLLLPLAGAHAQLITGRHGNTLTLMADGNFLVTGGVTGIGNAPTPTVEIYFTSAAAWGTAAPLTVPRSSHTATLMSDGRVLITGGFNAGAPLQSAEIYNPISGAWTVMNGGVGTDCTGRMCIVRGGHTATLLNKDATRRGKVLICGGQTAPAQTSITNTCELFDPATDTFSDAQAADMSSARMGHTATGIKNGKVFVCGGKVWSGGAWVYLPTTEIYDPVANSWAPKDPLNTGRAEHTATVLNNGNVFISGGFNGYNELSLQELPDSEPPVPAIQDAGSHGFVGSAEMFNPEGGRVPIVGGDYGVMPYRISRHSSVLAPDGKQITLGGYGNILPVLYNGPSIFAAGSYANLTAVSSTVATLLPTSSMALEIKQMLSRTVNGRIVDGDLFLMPVLDPAGDPTFQSDNFKVYLVQRTTATLDGSPVGNLIPRIPVQPPGQYWDDARIRLPNGTVNFTPQTVSADIPVQNYVVTSNIVFAPNNILSSSAPATITPAASAITIHASFLVPGRYVGGNLSGIAELTNANITSQAQYTMALRGGSGAIPATAVVSEGTNGRITLSFALTNIEGTVANIYPDTTTPLASGINAAGRPVDTGLTMKLSYTVDRIGLADLTYSHDPSNMIIREMAFSDELSFSPSTSKWAFNPISMPAPLFDFTSMVTPAADLFVAGGRNCEAVPYGDCIRARTIPAISSPTFTASRFYGAYISILQDAWPSFAALKTKRAFHTSTVLPDSSILTCGGSDGTVTLQSCELLDPASNTWIEVSSMTTPRSRHTATLLPNGTVLVVGGTGGSSTPTLNTAELFYPATRRWVPVQSMSVARQNHTANLLPNGDVLIAGGGGSSGRLSSAEIYKTTAAAWVNVTNTMSVARTRHVAVNTKSGDILMIGGDTDNGATSSVDRYYYTTNRFNNPTDPSDMGTPRYDHTATLLRDGQVLVSGGSNNTGSVDTVEIFDGTNWRYGTETMGSKRANHKSTLLPNGKIMVTGGERGGVAYGTAESYDPDLDAWKDQGTMSSRANHTTVLTRDNYLVNIGGWSGAQYLASCEATYFSYNPDQAGLDPKNRNPQISTGTTLRDRGESMTIISSAANFHGLTEASGGGAGHGNSSFSNPRVYIQAVDIPTGFLTDITTRLYTLYDPLDANSNWETTLSSMTLTLPSNPGELPYGYYNMRVAANGQFSPGLTVQVTIPRPTGVIAYAVPGGTVLSSTTVRWDWTQNSLTASDGYAIFSSSNDVFITTVTFSATASHTQSGLTPNTRISVKIGGYNTGGYSNPLLVSDTYYTFAVIPSTPVVTYASFETAGISWDPLGNSPLTVYEVSMSKSATFLPANEVIVPVPFNENYTSTNAVISALLPNQAYYFRVRAKNGNGIITDYSGSVTTTTVSNVTNLSGAPQTMSSINWSWDPAIGNPPYEVYDITAGTTPATIVFLASTTANSYTQTALSTNTPHGVAVNAYSGVNRGPRAYSRPVYTMAVMPLPGVPMVFTNITTGSFTLNWIANGNPAGTSYQLAIARDAGFTEPVNLTVNNTSTTVSNLVPNTQYYAAMRAVNGNGVATAPIIFGYDYTVAQAPSNFGPTGISMSGVSMAWNTGDNPGDTIYEVRGSTIAADLNSATPVALWTRAVAGGGIEITGLLTATTYYADVAAYVQTSNHENRTARTLSIPAVYTLAGPGGAPSGAMGGTSDPNRDVTITGLLPNDRTASITIPAGAFATRTAIAISSSVTNSCKQGAIPVVEVAIFTDNDAQPQVPVTLVLNYNNTEAQAGITNNSPKLVLARYNPVSGECLPLETKVDPGNRTITAKLNHFSLFQLVIRAIATDLSGVRVYPNPFYANRGQGFITINNVPASTDVVIYTLSGDKVWEGTAGSSGMLTWDGTNNAGVRVASGIYLAALDSSGGKKVVKIAIER